MPGLALRRVNGSRFAAGTPRSSKRGRRSLRSRTVSPLAHSSAGPNQSTQARSTVSVALRRALAVQKSERLALGPDYGAGEHVLCDEAGRPYHPDTISDYWRALCTEAQVPSIRLHDARHTCGTLMHMQGVPIVVISQWLGHADPAFTMRTYVHSQDDALNIAAASLQRVVTSS